MGIIDQAIRSNGWQSESSDNKRVVTLQIGSLRKQQVLIELGVADPQGQATVRFSSVCGPLSEQNAVTLLRFNSQMVHGAFAVEDAADGPHIVVRANALADTLSAMEVTQLVAALAWQADQAEEKLTGGDQN